MTDPSTLPEIDPNDTLDTGDDFTPLGYFYGTIKESFWSTPMAESDGKQTEEWAQKTRLYWLVEVEDILQPEFEGDVTDTTLAFGVGKAWEFDESGRYAIHPDQPPTEDIIARRAKNKVFSPSCMYGMILDMSTGKIASYDGASNVKELRVLDGGPPIEYDMAALGVYLRSVGKVNARDASIWKGLKFLFRGAGFVYRNTEDPDNVRMTTVPVALCGVPDAPAQAPQAPAQASTPAPTPAPAPAMNPTPAPIPTEATAAVPAPAPVPAPASQSPREATLASIRAAGADEVTMGVLTKLAEGAGNAGEFVRNASMLPAVTQNPAVAAMVSAAQGW